MPLSLLHRFLLLCSLSLLAPLALAASPLPIVFVHGTSGSAAQFETHAMRFTSNGFAQARQGRAAGQASAAG